VARERRESRRRDDRPSQRRCPAGRRNERGDIDPHDRVTSRVGMRDLRRSREPPQLPQPFARRTAHRRCVLRFGSAGADRVTRAGRARPREAARGIARRSRRQFEFITLTLTPRMVWMASSTRAKFPLPRGPSIWYLPMCTKDFFAGATTTPSPFSVVPFVRVISRLARPLDDRRFPIRASSYPHEGCARGLRFRDERGARFITA